MIRNVKRRTTTALLTDPVLTYAVAQVGKGYKDLTQGPDLFDCSGLTRQAWLRGGVDLPHNAEEQATFLRAVPATLAHKNALIPGDLIFYYTPITHVAMFTGWKLGLRRIVQATNEKLGVQSIWLYQYAKPVAYGYVSQAVRQGNV